MTATSLASAPATHIEDAPNKMDPKQFPFQRIVMAAGGTGGHIYPALALGQAIGEIDPHVEIFYCSGDRPAEIEIYRSSGIEPIVLPISGRRRGIVNHLKFARQLVGAYREAARRMKDLKPDLAVGFGNYQSVPAIMAARRRGAATVIHEQNAAPGLANRFLASGARAIFTAIDDRGGRFPGAKTFCTGNPIRRDLTREIDRAQARAEFGVGASERVCLCLGGSQGALGVNRLVSQVLAGLQKGTDGGQSPQWGFLWATGPANYDSIELEMGERKDASPSVTLRPYIDRMPWAYAAADLVLARAGALTLAEITALGKPSILVPLPTSAGQHQRANAEALAERGAAVLIEQSDPEAAGKIITLLKELGRDNDKLKRMGEAASALGRPEAGRLMAERLRELGLGEWPPAH